MCFFLDSAALPKSLVPGLYMGVGNLESTFWNVHIKFKTVNVGAKLRMWLPEEWKGRGGPPKRASEDLIEV